MVSTLSVLEFCAPGGEQNLKIGGQFLAPKMGPVFGSKIRSLLLLNRDSKKGPNFGPQKRTIIWPPFRSKFVGQGANFLVPFLGPLLAHEDVFRV